MILNIIYIHNEKREGLEILMSHAINESYDYVKKYQEKTNLFFLYEIPHMTSVLEKSGARNIEFFFTPKEYKPQKNEIVVSKKLPNGYYFNLKSTDNEIKKHIYEAIFKSTMQHLLYLVIFGILGMYFIHKMLLPLSHIAQQCKNYKDGNEFYLNDRFVSSEIEELKRVLNTLVRRFEELRKKDKEIFAEATHELKTPLAIIKARVDSYKENESHSKNKFIDSINEDIKRLYLEIKSMLYFNIFDFDEKEEFSILDEIKQSILKVEILLKARGLEYEINGSDFMLETRKKLFIKMFNSIFENALTYAKENSKIIIELENKTLKVRNIKGSGNNLFSSKLGTKILKKLSIELEFTFNIKDKKDSYEVAIYFN